MSEIYKKVNKLIASSDPSFHSGSGIWRILTANGESFPQAADQTLPVVIKVDVHVMASMLIQLGYMEYANIPKAYHERIKNIEIDEELLKSAQQELDRDRDRSKALMMDLWSSTDNNLTEVLYVVV